LVLNSGYPPTERSNGVVPASLRTRLRGHHPEDPANEGGFRTPPKRILLIANETAAAPGVVNRIEELVGDAQGEVFVVAPALTSSRLQFLAGEVDDAIEAARLRLDATLRMLQEAGLKASGEVGDSDPNMALEDALRRFPADEIVIETHPPGRSKWLEQDVVEKARSDIGLPVTHIVVDADRGDVAAIDRFQGHARDEAPTVTDYDLPRMPRLDVAAIVVGVLGTIALGVLALLCAGDISEEGMSAGCAIRIGLAIAAFLVTVFHVVALLFFGVVRYRGRAERFAANTLLYGIPPAILASLIAG
jgi:hypothetical protein